MRRGLRAVGIGAAMLLAGAVGLRLARPAASPAPSGPALRASIAVPPAPAIAAPIPAAAATGCDDGPADAASANAASLQTLAWAPFHQPETGWEIYAPRIAAEIGTTCAPRTNGFAAALARWQTAHRLPANGRLDAPTFGAMYQTWLSQRPFVAATRHGGCPAPPAPGELVELAPAEVYGKPERLTAPALAAYRRLVADARAAQPAIAADPKLLTVFSGFRDPAADAARCARENNCRNVTRAACSAHRTGTAIDMMVGNAAGQRPDSSAAANRLAQSKNPAYLWLVVNARRYGFVNYAFEPWHWEWTGP